MNPVIKAQLAEYAKSELLEKHKTELQFEIYSIFSVLNGFLGESVDACDVHLSGEEFGVDGAAILIQGELVKNRQDAEEKIELIKNPTIDFIFVQSKTSTSYDYGDISKFFDSIEEFFSDEAKGQTDQLDALIDAKSAIYESGVGKRNPKISAYYIATGNYESPKRIEALKDKFTSKLSGLNIFDSHGINISIVGARELQKWYRSATTSEEVEIEFAKNVVLPPNEHVQEAYIGYLNASQLVKLFSLTSNDGEVIGINKSVFFDNIRDYDPRSKINIEIKHSVLQSSGSDFVFRNNGITVVSKNIDRTGDRFRLEDFQIVNGCQTSNIIFDLIYGDDKEKHLGQDLLENIDIPFRLIGSKDDEFVASIIVGTNRQNPVKDEQFWALRPFMKSFEEYARSVGVDEVIYFERRDNQYKGQAVERVRIVQPAAMMKAIAAALLFQPQRAARDYRGIISEYSEMLFKDDHDVRVYHAVCFLHYRLEFLWRNQRIDTRFKTFRFYLICSVALVITSGRNVFGLKRSQQEAFARKMIELCKDEKSLIDLVVLSASIVESKLKDRDLSSQEKIRDAIRSDTFSMDFKETVKLTDFSQFSSYSAD